MIFEFKRENIKWQKGSYGLPECVYKIKVPSVTTIISEIPDPEWDEFIAKVGKEKAEQIMISAGNRGSSTHCFIENFLYKYAETKDVSEALKYTQEESPKKLREELIPDNKIEEGRNFFYKFYYSDYSNKFLDILAIELGVYSESLFYRGKLDVLYRDKLFGICLTDLKSSNGKIKKNSVKELKYKYQIAAYILAIEEMYKEKQLIVKKGSVLCIDKQSDILQEIILSGNDLIKYKEEWIEMVKDYHIKHNTEYLIMPS